MLLRSGGVESDDPVRTLELFAGSARLSHSLQLCGYSALAVDYFRNKQVSAMSVLNIDLSDPLAQRVV